MKTMNEYLEEIGFKKIYPDKIDKTTFFYRKNIEHPFLNGLHIIIDEAITVWCKAPTNKVNGKETLNANDGDITIYFDEVTQNNIEKIARWLITIPAEEIKELLVEDGNGGLLKIVFDQKHIGHPKLTMTADKKISKLVKRIREIFKNVE
jgi:hypothetical protein